jgi:hypothetical protein
MLDAGLRGAHRPFIASVFASVLVKEDACLPLHVHAAATGAVARRLFAKDGYAQVVTAATLLLGALLVGSGNRGYSLRPLGAPDLCRTRGARAARSRALVLVQSGLYPHAGYDKRFQLLTAETLHDPRHAGAAILLAHGVGAYPFKPRDLDALRQGPHIGPMPGGLAAVRLSQPSTH